MSGKRSPYFWTLTGPRRADGQAMTPADEDAAHGEFEVVTGERSPFGPSGIAGGPLTEVKPEEPETLGEALMRDPAGELPRRFTREELQAALDVYDRDARAFVGEL